MTENDTPNKRCEGDISTGLLRHPPTLMHHHRGTGGGGGRKGHEYGSMCILTRKSRATAHKLTDHSTMQFHAIQQYDMRPPAFSRVPHWIYLRTAYRPNHAYNNGSSNYIPYNFIQYRSMICGHQRSLEIDTRHTFTNSPSPQPRTHWRFTQ